MCQHASQLEPLDGQRVRLVGVYTPVPTLKKMPRPGRPREDVDLGEVMIELEGSASDYDSSAAQGQPVRIALGTDLRAEEEIARLRGRRVSVEGELRLHGHQPSPNVASRRPGPVLSDPAAPELAD